MAASFPDPAQPLHVVFASTAAGTLQRALDALHRRDAIVCLADDLSIGPIDGAGSRAAWLQSSHDLETAKRIADNRVVVVETSNANRISPVVWMSSVDARSYAGFLWWLAQVGDKSCRVIDVSRRQNESGLLADPALEPATSPSALPPAVMAAFIDNAVALDAHARAEYMARWNLLALENAPLRIVDRYGALVSAPITQFDALLLAQTTTAWQPGPDIIGIVLAAFQAGGVDQVGDAFLFHRIRELAASGALEARGNIGILRQVEVRLRR